eukprot:3925076-Alexandrium_andersonii.AAC.1
MFFGAPAVLACDRWQVRNAQGQAGHKPSWRAAEGLRGRQAPERKESAQEAAQPLRPHPSSEAGCPDSSKPVA